MKLIIIAVSIMVFFSLTTKTYAMRCSTHLINEGDTISRMIALCGQPQNYGQSFVYTNKDRDGMSYFIHADSNGVIDSINFSRE